MSDHLCQSAVSWFFFRRGNYAPVKTSRSLSGWRYDPGSKSSTSFHMVYLSRDIPPFLNNGTFTESEAKATKDDCRS